MTQASGSARWAELIQTLNELNKTYHDVCELGRKKHKALIVIDLKSIEAMNGEEARLTQVIRKLEETRQKQLIRLAVENRAITKDTKMSDLAKAAPTPQIRTLLEKLHQALDAATKEAAELHENNRLLIEGALSAVTYHLNRLGGLHVENAYGSKGQEVVTHAGKLEFDA
ncbi:flagellar protein FlgN [Selenomonas sp.]|uniref:flagellar protein FlgN n=1 Tax=Selenomonas sp. TaxID=2053611 RepID=UPI0025E69E02|nr:flagellar protein FlgN [Selenomonas sp.]MCI6087036.1 flagellar protein FlgN [Selenomonas sp.]MDY3296791.1 flagellar protein FlgN [Selenomonas sp.]MDY4416126.1 flagellar protein FlgN [Selenomonas sp.]